MKRLLFLIIFFVSYSAVYSQNQDSLLKVINLLPEKDRPAKLNELSESLQKNDPEKGFVYAKEALSISKKIKDQKQEALSYSNIAIFHWGQSDYPQALNFFQKAFDIYQKTNDKEGLASVVGDMGVVYKFSTQYDKALTYYYKAMTLYEELKDTNGIATYLNNIGRIHELQKNYDKALEMYNQSLGMFEKMNDLDGVSTLNNNIGLIYDKKQDFENALKYYEKALDIVKKQGDKYSLSIGLNNVGHIYKKMGDYNKALILYKQSIDIKTAIGDKRGLSKILINMGTLLKLMKQYDLAEVNIKKAINIASTAKLSELEMEGLNTLAFLYAEQKKFDRAFESYSRSMVIKDSLFTEKSNKQLLELQSKYDTKEKEKAIEILRKEKEINNLRLTKQEYELSKQKLVRNASIGGVVLLLFCAFLMYNRNKLKQKVNEKLAIQNQEIILQKDIIENKNKDILDSIKYAKRIQEAILPPEKVIKETLPDHFIFYKPKDIVSGDFYWIEKKEDKVFLAAVDCTGHGVPGAFMSIVGSNILKQSVNEHNKTRPADILDDLNIGVSQTLRQTYEDSTVKDGMDIAMCSFDLNSKSLQFAGANNPLYLLRDNDLIEIKGDKFPIGIFIGEEIKKFNNHELNLQKDDCFYIFSDGLADQFGGDKGKKFKYRQLKDILINNCKKTMAEQRMILEETFERWKGHHEQVDDILVIGVRVN